MGPLEAFQHQGYVQEGLFPKEKPKRVKKSGTERLKRIKQKRFDPDIGCADVETKGLGGIYLDGTVYTLAKGSRRCKTADDLLNMLLEPDAPRTWYFHNGANYDFSYIIQGIRDKANERGIQIETVLQGTKMISIIMPWEHVTSKGTISKKISISDSVPLLPGSLSKVTSDLAPEMAKSEHCPDHDFTKPGVFYSPDCDVCVEYMHMDAISLYHAVMNYKEIVWKAFGVNLKLTAGSTAMQAWLRTLPEGEAYYRQHPEREAYLRKFMFGGYCWPGSTSNPVFGVTTFDVKAAYAAQMKLLYPVDANPDWTDKYVPGVFGMYHCRVFVPEGLAMLPTRSDDNSVVYNTGWIDAYVCSEDIEFWTPYGCKFEVKSGLLFRIMKPIFKEFIDLCEKSEKDPLLKPAIKNARNSLSGKFGSKGTAERMLIGDKILDEDSTSADLEGLPPCNKETGEIMPYTLVTEEVDAPHMQPHWYAIMTSRQRRKMFAVLAQVPEEYRYKVDTDSLTVPDAIGEQLIAGGVITVGNAYGDFTVENEWAVLEMSGPKNYCGYAAKEGKWKYADHCKGVPQRLLESDPSLRQSGLAIPFDSARSPRDMLKTNAETPELHRIRKLGVPETVSSWGYDPASGRFFAKSVPLVI